MLKNIHDINFQKNIILSNKELSQFYSEANKSKFCDVQNEHGRNLDISYCRHKTLPEECPKFCNNYK